MANHEQQPTVGHKGADTAPPWGIRQEHIAPRGHRWVRPALLTAIIGGPIALALTGLLGGGWPARETARSATASLMVETPRVIRSGNWFETRVEIRPAAPITDLVLAIDDPLWRRLSIDTFAPDAEKSEYADRAFRYSFGPVAAGELRVIKFDGQIQPWGPRRLSGRYRVLDGERPLVSLATAVTVLP